MARTLISRKSTNAVTPTTFSGSCSEDVELGDVVIMTNDNWSKADCTISERTPASGIVVEKIGINGCRVASFGKVKTPFLIIPGKIYYLSTNGKIIDSEPEPFENDLVYSQQIGIAVSDSELLLNIKEVFILQPTNSYHTFINPRKFLLPRK